MSYVDMAIEDVRREVGSKDSHICNVFLLMQKTEVMLQKNLHYPGRLRSIDNIQVDEHKQDLRIYGASSTSSLVLGFTGLGLGLEPATYGNTNNKVTPSRNHPTIVLLPCCRMNN
jgi:hypothetical protein